VTDARKWLLLTVAGLCCAQLCPGWPRVRAEQPQTAGDDDALGFGDAPSAAPAPSALAPAAQPNGGDTDALGFGSAPPSLAVSAPAPAVTASAWTLSATLRMQAAVRLEQDDEYRLGKLRQVAGVRAEYKHDFDGSDVGFDLVASGRGQADFAYLLHLDAYDAPTLETYGAQLLWGESYLRLRSASFEVSFGEQIVNFGQGEILSALDLVNPRDLREPFPTEFDELRLPVLMSRVSFGLGRARLELLAVHEPFFGLLPPPLGEFPRCQGARCAIAIFPATT
jgi:hypothetical protein